MGNFPSLYKEIIKLDRRITALEFLNQQAEITFTESYIQLHPQWTDSWTTNAAYTDVTGALRTIDFDNWTGHEFFFEMVGKTDVGTGFYRLYNDTDSIAVPGSEISTTSTTPVRIRSSAIDLLSGVKDIKLQHKISGGGGGDFVNSIMSALIFKIAQ